MSTDDSKPDKASMDGLQPHQPSVVPTTEGPAHGPVGGNGDGEAKSKRRVDWKAMLGSRREIREASNRTSMSDVENQAPKRPNKWSMGILNDHYTEEVPGSILLLSKVSEYNEPLGLRNTPARTSASSLPSPYPPSRRSSMASHHRRPVIPEKKRTADGKIVLEPQPDDSVNDPLNWKMWRRDAALFSLGFYCMLGGGMTPILAAGFPDVADEYGVSMPQVALTTGLYMLGLGVGSVLLSPTAILYGKRPVYLVAAICYALTSVWCALSPNFASLVVARVVMGIAVSSVECLPSATVAEIYFLHEKAYRLGIYTLLLLGGKNLVPLASAAIIQSLGWRWVFWICAIIVAFGFCLLFLFVPETFWDRTPRPHRHLSHSHGHGNAWKWGSKFRLHSSAGLSTGRDTRQASVADGEEVGKPEVVEKKKGGKHAHFGAEDDVGPMGEKGDVAQAEHGIGSHETTAMTQQPNEKHDSDDITLLPTAHTDPSDHASTHSSTHQPPDATTAPFRPQRPTVAIPSTPQTTDDHNATPTPLNPYTDHFRASPPKTFRQQIHPFSGRLTKDRWHRVALRPFILFAYPSILWSTLVYSLSVGWLIVLSESVAEIYQHETYTYNFNALQTGLVYLSPFIGGVLGTAVAGKVSDVLVRYLSRRNGGVYEPEFRLVMAFPVALSTAIGLMGYGWSAEDGDAWIVPTIFFGLISFGCSLGSTTAITFAVDSYRQYAGEALVTLNLSKNVLHGLVFSLFFNRWLESKGAREVFLVLGGCHLGVLVVTTPLVYVYGKRARMWTVRKGLMEKF